MLNDLVNLAVVNRPELAGLGDVVEKEILHHDILYVLHNEGILQQLTFIGGTSLRLCYFSSRLSEDLDFTAGVDFVPEQLEGLGERLRAHLEAKYGLNVRVSEPKTSESDTATWKLTIEKYGNRPDLPSQKMHIDVCSLPSFDIEHRAITDHYGINSPIGGMPIPVQSLAEILADKMIAFTYRERRIKPRDVWDIVWLKQQRIRQSPELILKKLDVRNKQVGEFLENIAKHALMVQTDPVTKKDFEQEMMRFVPTELAERTVMLKDYWPYVGTVIEEEVDFLEKSILSPSPDTPFSMS